MPFIASVFIVLMGCREMVWGSEALANASETSLMTWSHENTSEDTQRPLVDEQIRRSSLYEVELMQEGLTDSKRSFVYLSIPRSGMAKRPIERRDGAEASSAAQRTMPGPPLCMTVLFGSMLGD